MPPVDAPPEGPARLSGCTVATEPEPGSVLLPGHDVPLGRYTTVRRLLPHRQRRMVGAWCFVDHFGPEDVRGRPGMQIAPHPHTGLQTLTWLVEGEVLHRDSLGSEQLVRPGQVNLMTAGRGIAHSEQSPPEHPPGMHGVQLWAALPDATRHAAPAFEHHAELPVLPAGAARTTVVVGELAGARSPASVRTPLLAVEVLLPQPQELELPLQEGFEHGVLALSGSAAVDGTDVAPGSLLHLEPGRSALRISSGAPARLLLLGGEPFEEPLVMWWNFVARTHEEVVAARRDWEAGRFGEVPGAHAAPLPAPAMPAVRLKARDRHGSTRG